MSLIILISVVVLIYFIAPHYPFIAGLVAMIPIKIISALLFGNDLQKITDGLLLGSVVTTACLMCLWGYFKWA